MQRAALLLQLPDGAAVGGIQQNRYKVYHGHDSRPVSYDKVRAATQLPDEKAIPLSPNRGHLQVYQHRSRLAQRGNSDSHTLC